MNMKVFLRPKTGFQKGKFNCMFTKTGIYLKPIQEALFDFKQTYYIPYKKMLKFEDHNYMWVPGLDIYVYDNVEIPPIPSGFCGGLIGALISSFKSKRNMFRLYFNSVSDKQYFIQMCEIGANKEE